MTPRTYRPLGARVAASGLAAILVAVAAVMWLSLSEPVRAQFSHFQRLTLLFVLTAILAVLYGVWQTAVRADDNGLRIVNIYKVRHLDWPAVLGVSLRRGQPWAVLDVADGTTVSAMGIQGSDGERAMRAVRELSTLIGEQTRVYPDS